MRKNFTNTFYIVVSTKYRPAGKGIIHDEEREWGEAHQITCVAVEDEKCRLFKFTIAPDRVPAIWPKLTDLCWGTLVELEFDGRLINDVHILCDWLDKFVDSVE